MLLFREQRDAVARPTKLRPLSRLRAPRGLAVRRLRPWIAFIAPWLTQNPLPVHPPAGVDASLFLAPSGIALRPRAHAEIGTNPAGIKTTRRVSFEIDQLSSLRYPPKRCLL